MSVLKLTLNLHQLHADSNLKFMGKDFMMIIRLPLLEEMTVF